MALTISCIAFLAGDNINICWSPDGNNIAVGNKDDLVTFIDARTWKPFADEQFKFEVILFLTIKFPPLFREALNTYI